MPGRWVTMTVRGMAIRIAGGVGTWGWVQAVGCGRFAFTYFRKRLGTPHSAMEDGICWFTGTKGVAVGLSVTCSMKKASPKVSQGGSPPPPPHSPQPPLKHDSGGGGGGAFPCGLDCLHIVGRLPDLHVIQKARWCLRGAGACVPPPFTCWCAPRAIPMSRTL